MKKLLTNLSHLAKDKKAWLALVAGLFLTLSYAPYNLWFITFLSLGALLYCINPLANGKLAAKQSTKYGFIFGLGWFGAGISWVHVSIATFGGMPLIASLSLMVLLCAYLALYPALAAWLTTRLAKGPYSFICWLLAAIATTEYLRGTLLTGFPWLSFGYTQTDSPLNFLAPVIGEFGITLVCMLIAFALYRIAYKDTKPLIASVALLAGLYTIANSNQLHYQDKTIKTVLVQGNIKQHLRFEPSEFWTTMSKYQDMTRLHWNADLIVWPEAAVPELEALSTEYLTGLNSAATFNNTALITGIVDYQYDTRNIFNTLIVLGKKEQEDSEGDYQYLGKNRYQKHQLLPIGEFVPFQDFLRPIAPLFDLPMSSFTRGDEVQNNLRANSLNILPAICYEIAFSELVRGNYRSDSDILFTVSNDAWFGDSHGPHQHMQIARMRALELQRPLIRVTNNGISAVYDPIAKSQLAMPQFKADVLEANITLIKGDSIYSQYGNWPVWAVVILLSTVGLILRLKK